MKTKIYLLFVFLVVVIAHSYAQDDKCLKITLKAPRDTIAIDSPWDYNKFTITLQNVGKADVRLIKDNCFNYEDDYNTISTLYFKTYYFSKWGRTEFSHKITDIDYIYDPRGEKDRDTILKPGQKLIFKANPFSYSGYEEGKNEYQVEAYYRIRHNCYDEVFKSDQITVFVKRQKDTVFEHVDIPEFYSHTKYLFEKGDYKGALKRYSKLIDIDPFNAVFAYEYGLCAQELGKRNEAYWGFYNAVSSSRNINNYYYKLAEEQYRSGVNFDLAIEKLQMAYAISGSKDSLREKVVSFFDSVSFKANEEKIAYIKKVDLVVDSLNYNKLHEITSLYIQNKQFKKALKYIHVLRRHYTDSLEPVNMEGWCYLSTGKFEKAISIYDPVLKNNPTKLTSARLYYNRAFCKYKLNKYTEALEDIEASVKINPKNSYAYKNRALIHIAMNEKDKVCPDLYIAKGLGYTNDFGNEVEDLIKENCK